MAKEYEREEQYEVCKRKKCVKNMHLKNTKMHNTHIEFF